MVQPNPLIQHVTTLDDEICSKHGEASHDRANQNNRRHFEPHFFKKRAEEANDLPKAHSSRVLSNAVHGYIFVATSSLEAGLPVTDGPVDLMLPEAPLPTILVHFSPTKAKTLRQYCVFSGMSNLWVFVCDGLGMADFPVYCVA